MKQTGGFKHGSVPSQISNKVMLPKFSQPQDPCVVSRELRPLYKNEAHLHISFGPLKLFANSEFKYQAYVSHVLTSSGLKCSLGITNCLYFGAFSSAGLRNCQLPHAIACNRSLFLDFSMLKAYVSTSGFWIASHCKQAVIVLCGIGRICIIMSH